MFCRLSIAKGFYVDIPDRNGNVRCPKCNGRGILGVKARRVTVTKDIDSLRKEVKVKKRTLKRLEEARGVLREKLLAIDTNLDSKLREVCGDAAHGFVSNISEGSVEVPASTATRRGEFSSSPNERAEVDDWDQRTGQSEYAGGEMGAIGLLNELVLKLKADQGVVADKDGKVSRWEDLSGNKNHAVQGNGPNQPLAKSDGHSLIWFDGVDDFLTIRNDDIFNFDTDQEFRLEVSIKIPRPIVRTRGGQYILAKVGDGGFGRYPFKLAYNYGKGIVGGGTYDGVGPGSNVDSTPTLHKFPS